MLTRTNQNQLTVRGERRKVIIAIIIVKINGLRYALYKKYRIEVILRYFSTTTISQTISAMVVINNDNPAPINPNGCIKIRQESAKIIDLIVI